MTTTVLRAVKFVGARIDKLTSNEVREDQKIVFWNPLKQDLKEGIKFWVYLAGPILLPILIMYLEVKF